jgi:hypothetical protein
MSDAKKFLILSAAFGTVLTALVSLVAWEADSFRKIVIEVRTEIREVRTIKETEIISVKKELDRLGDKVDMILVAIELEKGGPEAARAMIMQLSEDDR